MARLISGVAAAACVSATCMGGAPPTCPDGVVVTLWPPNHEYHALDLAAIAGAHDPDGGTVMLIITSITQDEPVNGIGDGNTTCDGTGIGTGVAHIRAERQGSGDGRVYHIDYTAIDPTGAMCDGTVAVLVPHDQSNLDAVDSGQTFDATPCLPAADLDGSGSIDMLDLVLVLTNWGESGWSDGDVDHNGIVNALDLAAVLSQWSS